MYHNYFKLAWRILMKQKLYSSIKIGGFALGIAACFLIALFIKEELSYDTHFVNGKRIYRATVEYHDKGNIVKGVHFPSPFATVLKAEFPEVAKAGRLNAGFGAAGKAEVRCQDRQENAYEEGIALADQELLEILEVPMIYGDPKQALNAPNTIVISKRKADKYFPGENPVGKILILNNDEKKPYKIGAVMADFPATSHLQYDFFLTLKGEEFWPNEQTSWLSGNYITYTLLQPGASAAQLEPKLSSLVEKYVVSSLKEVGNVDAATAAKNTKYKLQAVGDIYLNSDGILDTWTKYGDKRYVWLFGAIAVFILIIASINFINLSTAKSANRAKEVGLRKVLGTYRSQLIKQFLAEAFLYSALALALGLLLSWLLLPYFNELALKSLAFPWRDWWLIPVTGLAVLLIGFLAGIYPAFYLSAFKPIQVLKGQVSQGSKSSGTRSLLVVFQFTVSIVLIVGTFVIYRQMGYMLNKKVGFDKDQVILLQGAQTLGDQVKTLKTELLRLPQVKNVSVGDYLPVKDSNRNQNPFWKEGKQKEDSPTSGQIWRIDPDYIKTLGMKLAAGRDFSERLASDAQGIIINQAMVKAMGLTNPLGHRIANANETWTIIGVVEDFHFESMKQSIEPLCLAIGNSPSVVSVKVNATEMAQVLEAVTKVWKSLAPYQPIRYTFLDESYARMYDDVQRTGRILSSFAVLAIIVACLGLFALSAFMVEQRSKEISIRLVLGASTSNIFRLLTQNFLKLVLIALIIAVPIAWYGMHKWLQDYEYRITITWDVFLWSGLIAGCIAVLTISYQSIRATFMKPVDSLRNE